MRRICQTTFLIVLLFAMGTDISLAQRGGDRGATAASSKGTYSMTSDADVLSTVKTTSFSIGSEDLDVAWFSVRVEWDAFYATLDSYDETSYLESHLGYTNKQVDQGSNYIQLEYEITHPEAFFVGGYLLVFNWTTPCQADGSTNTLTLNPALAGNTWSRVGQTGAYNPSSATSGSADVITYTGDVFPVAVSGAIGTDLKVPLKISNNFCPEGGITATVTFDDSKLDYVGFDTVGTYSGGRGDITITETSGSLDIVDAGDEYGQTGETVWFYLDFRNTMSDTGESSTVTVTEWEQEGECNLASVGETADASADASTPQYSADIYYENNVSVAAGYYKDVFMQLTNNFSVDMDEDENTTRAAFRPDGDTWTQLDTSVGTVSPVSNWFWRRRPELAVTVKIVEQDPLEESDSIPPSSTRANVAKIRVKGQTAGTQAVGFKAADTLTSLFKEDSKLKAMRPAYTLHTKSDGLFRTHSNTITVTSGGGGGGSCPFVYTWDGTDFKLEDAVLTESEKLPEGTPVVDYLPLTFQPALEGGKYRLRIHEEEAEKTFLDDAELLVIDHAPGYEASVTTEGEIVFGNGRVHPWGVVDDAGNDVTQLVMAQDDNRFEGHGSGSLIATFNRREGEFYALGADDSTEGGKGYCEVRQGPLQAKPEPTTVKVEVEDAQGIWHALPDSPLRLPKTRIRPVIDLSGYDLPVMFRIRYSWDGDYSLDEIALSVQVPVEHTVTSALAAGIMHSSDHSSAKLAAQEDGRYAELVTGEYLDLEFPASPVPEGMERSLVLKTRGYFMQWFGDQNAGRPLVFGLNGNYPNPFNPSTTIRYSLASDAVVTLDVFNVLGQRVRTLISGLAHPAGSFEAVWDGRDDQGYAVGSGAYLYRLKAGDFTETRKMVMLK